MGKSHKVKKELFAAKDLVGLIQTLKDIADNKFYVLSGQRDKFRRFGETFVDFFRMMSLGKAEHPLIANDNPKTAILVVTIEGSFLGEFNNRVASLAIEQERENKDVKFILIGDRKVDRFKEITSDIEVFTGLETEGLYETAVKVKDYLVDEIMNGRLGKVIVVYSWPKDMETQKQRLSKLLPCEDLLTKQAEFTSEFANIIEESDAKEIIGYLCNLWITTRLYDMFVDTLISSAAAQAKFLDDRVDELKKERNKTFIRYRKAKKGDIDKSLRETFSARMLVTKS